MAAESSLLAKTPIRELLVFIVLLLLGLTVLPLAVFYVGDLVFGSYGGDGFGHFLETLFKRLGSADRFVWLLVLSPYVVFQLFRITRIAWRLAGQARD